MKKVKSNRYRIIHKRIANTERIDNELYAILDYFFYKDEMLLTQQTLKLRLLGDRELIPMFKTAGFLEKNIDRDRYHVYVKSQAGI